jgi:hypothetical protein
LALLNRHNVSKFFNSRSSKVLKVPPLEDDRTYYDIFGWWDRWSKLRG